MADLFSAKKEPKESSYSAQDIEVLEGLEPVRRRPGMYIGGTDEGAMHHLVNEVFDNSMDEAVAGYATTIHMDIRPDNVVMISDNGRGIPIDPHPKFKKKSALEVILTTLHSGGKFGGKVYDTSGGLHGVGISVVNALSDHMEVEVIRDKTIYQQSYSRGEPQEKLKKAGQAARGKGTKILFHPDPEIFGNAKFKPEKLFKLARSKAYLFRGVQIEWKCDASLIADGSDAPEKATIHFPDGLKDFLKQQMEGRTSIISNSFCGEADLPKNMGRAEWAIEWPDDEESFVSTYCNTIPTPDGGTHENGMRLALTKGIKAYGELVGNKKIGQATGEDMLGGDVRANMVYAR